MSDYFWHDAKKTEPVAEAIAKGVADILAHALASDDPDAVLVAADALEEAGADPDRLASGMDAVRQAVAGYESRLALRVQDRNAMARSMAPRPYSCVCPRCVEEGPRTHCGWCDA